MKTKRVQSNVKSYEEILQMYQTFPELYKVRGVGIHQQYHCNLWNLKWCWTGVSCRKWELNSFISKERFVFILTSLPLALRTLNELWKEEKCRWRSGGIKRPWLHKWHWKGGILLHSRSNCVFKVNKQIKAGGNEGWSPRKIKRNIGDFIRINS